MYKNYGTKVTRKLTEDPSIIQVIYQKGKPVLDSELNLYPAVETETKASIVRDQIHSGWYTWNGVSGANTGTGILSTTREFNISFDLPCSSGTASLASNSIILGNTDEFNITKTEIAYVNGWKIFVGGYELSSTCFISGNVINLPNTTPVTEREDFVFLEVWLKLLDPATGDGMYEISTGNYGIFPYGNTERSSDTLEDQIVDPSLKLETTKRVQIQYRFRPTSEIVGDRDNGFGPTILAQGGTSAPVAGYTFERHSSDFGLWISGSGDSISATDLGTVDGYVYAIPACLVQRRNSNTFDSVSNFNGSNFDGLTGSSDRPDGLSYLYTDIIDVKDLRHRISFNDASYRNSLENTLHRVLTGNMDGNTDSSPEINPSAYGSSVLKIERLFTDDIANHNDFFLPEGPDNIRVNFTEIGGSFEVYYWFKPDGSYTDSNSTFISYISGTLTIQSPSLPLGVTLEKISMFFYDGTAVILDSESGIGPGSTLYTAELNSTISSDFFFVKINWTYPANAGYTPNHLRNILYSKGTYENLGARQIGYAGNHYGSSVNPAIKDDELYAIVPDSKAIDYATTVGNIQTQFDYPKNPTPPLDFTVIPRTDRGSCRQIRLKLSTTSAGTITVSNTLGLDCNFIGVFAVTTYVTEDNFNATPPSVIPIVSVTKNNISDPYEYVVIFGAPYVSFEGDVWAYIDTDAPGITYSETAKSIISTDYVVTGSITADGVNNTFYLDNPEITSDIKGFASYVDSGSSSVNYCFVGTASVKNIVEITNYSVSGPFFITLNSVPVLNRIIHYYFVCSRPFKENGESMEIYHQQTPYFGKTPLDGNFEILEIGPWIVSSLGASLYPYYGTSYYTNPSLNSVAKFFKYKTIVPELLTSTDLNSIFSIVDGELEGIVYPEWYEFSSNDYVERYFRYPGPFGEGFNSEGSSFKKGSVIDIANETTDGEPFAGVFAYEKKEIDKTHFQAIPLLVKNEFDEVKLLLIISVPTNSYVKFLGGEGVDEVLVAHNLSAVDTYAFRIFDVFGKPLVR